jgi:prevent-host-death family protein
MNTVGIKELKNRLTHYMRLAKAGHEIIVTERNKPVALIQKIDMVRQPRSEEAILARLAAEGSIKLGKEPARARFKPIRIKGRSLSAVIIADRKASRF